MMERSVTILLGQGRRDSFDVGATVRDLGWRLREELGEVGPIIWLHERSSVGPRPPELPQAVFDAAPVLTIETEAETVGNGGVVEFRVLTESRSGTIGRRREYAKQTNPGPLIRGLVTQFLAEIAVDPARLIQLTKDLEKLSSLIEAALDALDRLTTENAELRSDVRRLQDQLAGSQTVVTREIVQPRRPASLAIAALVAALVAPFVGVEYQGWRDGDAATVVELHQHSTLLVERCAVGGE